MRGRGAGAILTILILSFLLPARPVAGDDTPPVITEVSWSPRYPISPSDVTLSARVSDPDGVFEVQGTWCTVDGLCTFPPMYHMGNGLYQANVSTLRDTTAAGYQVFARDTYMNEGHSEKIWVLYADSLTLTLDPPVVAANPSSTALVNGTAFYGPNSDPGDGENRSAPAEGVTVRVTVDGVVTEGAVDASGSFSISVSSPSTEGTFPINVVADDRTLHAETSGTMAVSAVPLPDLRVANLLLSPAKPVAGDRVLLEFDVENIGSADAVDVRILVYVRGIRNPVFDESVSVPRGESIHRAASWRALEGIMAIHFSIDPEGAITELDKENNLEEFSATASPAPRYALIAAIAGIAAGVITAVWALRRRRTLRLSQEHEGKDT